MDQHAIKKYWINYLKEHRIEYYNNVSDGESSIIMCFHGMDGAPDYCLEGCIYFYTDCVETRNYFNEKGSLWIKEHQETRGELYRILNWLNATVWPRPVSEFYEASYLFCPRFYLTEDEDSCFCITTVIDHDLMELAPLEGADFVAKTLPELLNTISPVIFNVVFGKIKADQGIELLQRLL